MPTLELVANGHEAALTNATLAKLLKRLTKLHQDELRILWAFSVVCVETNQTTMVRLLDHLEWKTQRGGKLCDLMAKPLREKLLKQQLLVPSRGKLRCAHELSEVLARQAVQQGVYRELVDAAAVIVPLGQNRYDYGFSGEAPIDSIRKIRDGLYLDDNVGLQQALKSVRYEDFNYVKDLVDICTNPFEPLWFAGLDQGLQYQVLSYPRLHQTMPMSNVLFDYLTQAWDSGCLNHVGLARLLAQWRIDRGLLDSAHALLPDDNHWHTLKLQAWILSLKGDHQAAIALYEVSQKQARKDKGMLKLFLQDMAGVGFLLSLLSSQDSRHQQLLSKQLKQALKSRDYNNYDSCLVIIDTLCQALAGVEQFDSSLYLSIEEFDDSDDAILLCCLAWHWLGETPSREMLGSLAAATLASQQPFESWLVSQSVGLLQHYNYSKPATKGLAALLKQDVSTNQVASLLLLIEPQQAWQRALQALQNISGGDDASGQNNQQAMRLCWFLEETFDSYAIQPKEQKLSKNGIWSKGRNVSLKRLSQGHGQMPYLSDADVQVCQAIVKEQNYYGSEYFLHLSSALPALVGHPLLYWLENPEQPIELSKGEPELVIRKIKQQLSIHIHPPIEAETETGFCYLDRLSEYKFQLIEFTQEHNKIAKILGEEGLTVPFSAKDQVLKSIAAVAPLLAIQSDIGGAEIGATELPCDQSLYMRIQPRQDLLVFNLLVQPLGEQGPNFSPGKGRAIVMAEIEGQRVLTHRQLDGEQQQHQALLKLCPVLADYYADDDHYWEPDECEWQLQGDEALEALYQLQNHADSVQLLWPQGGRLNLSRETGVGQMQVSVSQRKDWFALEGNMQLDNGELLSMGKLLALMQDSPGRFIRLENDQFITLTKQLHQRLHALRQHGDQQQYHPLAAPMLEDLTNGMVLSGDDSWQQQKQRINQAYQIQPELPTTLQAQLRDYQQEGFVWLARLAHWGAGACLADDMGLGKTMQALALILSRTSQGPTLVLAPTSVCMNWLQEAKRFAPSLNVFSFGDGDRQQLMDSAGPFDLVVCSYGLLQTEQSRLQKVHWQSIVADEAQALKNPRAKRSQAAMSLTADFKMITTGTPIENHLGELWSLFRFINPGLLGSQEAFNKRFASPIANSQDKQARQQLKRLVQPFILRRLKTDVLTELPARTEITINVSQSKEEAVFYEALRRQAVEKLSGSEQKSGQKHLQVLAEIMRLRRACCHPRLVIEDSKIPSSKLAAFAEIVDELRDSGHRVLVFSQFVSHLSLIREYVESRDISYQYLDGSTPRKQREKAVNAFQNGEGELFLISLKAGGSGLNLTAADYVVHMDPWWNPAVEDQASDRAHRIGQKRPVTIYRLVCENTIEQQIIALHQQKRDLADALLEGSDMGGKLSADEIMELIAQA